MTTRYANVPATVLRETSITCDRCGKVTDSEDTLGRQEYFQIDFTGGYTSIFGDGTHVRADLCDTCLQQLITPFARITPEG
jgi:hypothetical protein